MLTLSFYAPILIAWFITNFQPWQTTLDNLYKLLPDWFQFTREYLMCFKCMSFWITLIVTHNFLLAILFSMLAYTYSRIMSSLKLFF